MNSNTFVRRPSDAGIPSTTGIGRRLALAARGTAGVLLTLLLFDRGGRESAADDSAPALERVELWPDGAPLGDGKFEKADCFITVYRQPAVNGPAPAFVICPGGAYALLADQPEGHGIARWLGQHGIAGVVLNYRLPAGRSRVPLLDAQRALRLTRASAKAWDIDPDRIGILGFSAGGHLASTAATRFDEGDPRSTDPVGRVSCRPDFAALIYPVVSMGPIANQGSKDNLLGANPTPELIEWFSNAKHVTDRTPPTFLAHAKDDKVVVPENSGEFYAALQKHHVPSEFLELPEGGHGLNGYQGPMWDAWQRRLLEWLAEQKIARP